MQFSAVTVAIASFSGLALAHPAIDSVQLQAQASLKALEANGCSTLKCLAAVAPMAVGCAAALAEAGVNPLADLACYATIANNVANPPAACSGCL